MHRTSAEFRRAPRAPLPDWRRAIEIELGRQACTTPSEQACRAAAPTAKEICPIAGNVLGRHSDGLLRHCQPASEAFDAERTACEPVDNLSPCSQFHAAACSNRAAMKVATGNARKRGDLMAGVADAAPQPVRRTPRRRSAVEEQNPILDTKQQPALTQNAREKSSKVLKSLERVSGIEPPSSAWKAVALPLSYTRAAPPI